MTLKPGFIKKQETVVNLQLLDKNVNLLTAAPDE
jgi:hypothetical protein